MECLTCGLINLQFVIFNITTDVFFMFCMVRPLHGERIKQPLKLLLWSLLCSTLTFLLTLTAMFFSQTEFRANKSTQPLYFVFGCSLTMSMTSSVWLNFFYYIQIVPAQRALFIWIKKNIKAVIFCIWIFERLCDISFGTLDFVLLYPLIFGGLSNNSTIDHINTNLQTLSIVNGILFLSGQLYHAICLCVMVMSSGCTVVYLCRHMRRMAASGQPLSCPRVRGQVRVTVTGILQGVMYALCAGVTMYKFLFDDMPSKSVNMCTEFTIINMYMLGTMFSLGVGQSVFRQRAADIWLRAAQLCKATKQQTEQEG